MFISAKRAFVLMCAVFVFVLLTGLQSIKHNRISNLLQHALKNTPIVAPSFLTEPQPFWATELLVPRFAYVQYATDIEYLCNAILIFPETWMEGESRESKAIRKIQEELPNLVMRPFGLLSTHQGDATWANSLTKFHAFDLTEYTRVLAFDSDSQVLNSMDHYFLAPMAALAVPRAYWLTEKDTPVTKQVLSSHVMLLEPNRSRYEKVVREALRSGDFDMEVVNHMFKDSAMILPHRHLALLTGELRSKDHKKYLAPDNDEEWDAMLEVSRAYLVHFSDWPLPKPWLPHSDAQWQASLPDCPKQDDKPDRPRCADRTIWSAIYMEFKEDRERYCNAWI
ncbi:glucose N-acetyltransferase [Colletotrichum tofieldiae]|nr:glucose N-acetyltransferase [Colletotrichum tofieldiae]